MVSNAGFSFPVMETSSENDSLEQPRLGTDWQGSSNVEEAWGTGGQQAAHGQAVCLAAELNKQEHSQ